MHKLVRNLYKRLMLAGREYPAGLAKVREKTKKEFRIAARDDDKKIKKTANSWIKYTENEEIRVKNLALRRDYIQNQG